MQSKIFQHYYTSTSHGIDGGSGFRCKAISPDMPHGFREKIERYISYKPPRTLPSVSAAPTSLRYALLDREFAVLSHITFTNKIEGEVRGGNFFAHSLLLPSKIASRISPISLAYSSLWKASCEDDLKELETLSEAQLMPSFSLDDSFSWLREPFHQEITRILLANFFSNKKKPCLLFAETKDVEYLVAAVTYYLPPALRHQFTFSTYDHEIERGFDLTRLIDQSEPYFSSRKSDLLIDLYNQRHNFRPTYSAYVSLAESFIKHEQHKEIERFYDAGSSLHNFDWFAHLDFFSAFELASKGIHELKNADSSFFLWLCQQLDLISVSQSTLFDLLTTYSHFFDKDSLYAFSSALEFLQSKDLSLADQCVLWFALHILQQIQRGDRSCFDLLSSQPKLFLGDALRRLILSESSSDFCHAPTLYEPFWKAIELQPRIFWLFYRWLAPDAPTPIFLGKVLEALFRKEKDLQSIVKLLSLHESQISSVLPCLLQKPFLHEFKHLSISFYLSLVQHMPPRKRQHLRKILEPSYGLSFLLSEEATHDFSSISSPLQLQSMLYDWQGLFPFTAPQTNQSIIASVQQAIQTFPSKAQSEMLDWMEQQNFGAFISFDFILHKLGKEKAHTWLVEKLYKAAPTQGNAFFTPFLHYLQGVDERTMIELFQAIFDVKHQHFSFELSKSFLLVLDAFCQKNEIVFWQLFLPLLSSLCEYPHLHPLVASFWEHWYPQLNSSDPKKQLQAHRFIASFFSSLPQKNSKNFQKLASFLKKSFDRHPCYLILQPFLPVQKTSGFFSRWFGR